MPWLKALRHTVRQGLSVERAVNEPAAVVRAGAGVALVLFGSLALGGPRLAVSAALGAQMAGMATFQSSYRPRPFLALAAAAGLALSSFVSYLAAPFPALYLVVLGCWAFACGMAWCMGRTAGTVAALTIAVMVLVVTLPLSVREAAEHAGVIACGGVVQAALVQFFPVRPWGRHRDALADAYASLADYARRLRHEPLAAFDPEALMTAREASMLTRRQARLRPLELSGLRPLAEGVRPVMAALADPRVGAAEEGPERDRARELLAAAAELLDAAARSVRTGRPSPAPDRAFRALAVPEGGPVLSGPGRRAANRLIGLLAQVSDALEEPPEDDQGHAVRYLTRPSLLELVPEVRRVVRRNWTWRSPILRHAVRCAVVVVVGDLIGRQLPGHGYWVPLTSMMVMRPDFSQTYSRGVARLSGTVLGVGVATAVMAAAAPVPWACGVLAVAAVSLTYLLLRAGYFAVSVCVSAYVVFLLSMASAPLWSTVEQRIVLTVMGGALALVGYALWPTWQTVRLPDRLAAYVESGGVYAARAVAAYAEPGTESARAVRDALLDFRDIRARLGTTITQAEAEPIRHRGLRPSQLSAARGAMAALGRTAMLLEAHAPAPSWSCAPAKPRSASARASHPTSHRWPPPRTAGRPPSRATARQHASWSATAGSSSKPCSPSRTPSPPPPREPAELRDQPPTDLRGAGNCAPGPP